MTYRVAATIVLAFLSGCASSPKTPEPIPGKAELIGEFWMGDGLGVCESMELRADETYKGRLCGGEHMGLGSSYREGRWQLDGKYLFFLDKNGKYKAPKSFYTYAEVFYYKGKPAFSRAEHIKDGSVYDWEVFEKQPEK